MAASELSMASSKLTMTSSNPLELDCTISHNPSEEEQAIFDCLTTYLPAESSITADEAVQQIITLFPEDLDTTGTSFIYLFWQLVFCVGSQLDYQQEPMQRFIALLATLEILPDKIQGSAYPGRNSHASTLYFTFAFGDQWDSMFLRPFSIIYGLVLITNTLGLLQDKIPSPKSARQLQNINGLRLYMHLNGFGHCFSYALETITKALENTKLNEPQVRAAAVWFTMRPSWIYHYCLDRLDRDPEKRGALWTGMPRRGYSISRWMFWRKRFAQICDRPDVEEETAQICRDAVQGMDSVSERGKKIKIVEMCLAFLQKFGC